MHCALSLWYLPLSLITGEELPGVKRSFLTLDFCTSRELCAKGACCMQASIQMEAMGCRGALQVGVDLLDRFGQGDKFLHH
jgi:hypothetical protein